MTAVALQAGRADGPAMPMVLASRVIGATRQLQNTIVG